MSIPSINEELNPYAVGGLFGQYKMMQKKAEEWQKPWTVAFLNAENLFFPLRVQKPIIESMDWKKRFQKPITESMDWKLGV